MDTGLTTIPEADIEKHRATAQSMITRDRRAGGFVAASRARRLPAPAGASSRRFRPARCARRARSSWQRQSLPSGPTTSCCRSPSTRCSIAPDAASRSRLPWPTSSPAPANWKACRRRTRARRSKAMTPAASRSCCRPRPMSPPSPSPPISLQLIDSDGEAPNDITEPDFLFDTPQDALKSMVAGLDAALVGTKDDADLACARAASRASPSTGC